MTTNVKNNSTKKVGTTNLSTKNLVKVTAKKIVTPKKETIKKPIVFKSAKVSFHAPLLACNKADKLENFSLSGAIKRLKKQVFDNEVYTLVDTNVLLTGFEFDNILKYVSQKNIDSQKFSVFSVGLAFNKYLKTVI